MLSISHTNNKYIFLCLRFYIVMYVGWYASTGCQWLLWCYLYCTNWLVIGYVTRSFLIWDLTHLKTLSWIFCLGYKDTFALVLRIPWIELGNWINRPEKGNCICCSCHNHHLHINSHPYICYICKLLSMQHVDSLQNTECFSTMATDIFI